MIFKYKGESYIAYQTTDTDKIGLDIYKNNQFIDNVILSDIQIIELASLAIDWMVEEFVKEIAKRAIAEIEIKKFSLKDNYENKLNENIKIFFGLK